MSAALSPVVYDITVSTLKGDSATDLAVSIIGDKNVLNLGENIKLTINAQNNGPFSADVKVDYKIPFGLKLLSSNGSGIYDPINGVWNVGILPAGTTVTLDLILQATHAGYIVNIASVYGSMSFYGINGLNSGSLRIFAVYTGGFVRTVASMSDPDPSNNQANYGISSQDPTVPPDKSEMIIVPGTFPDVVPCPAEPPSPPNLPGPGSDDSSQLNPFKPQGQLARDIVGVREAVSSGEPKKPVPSFVLPLENSENRDKDGEIPLWVYVMAILGFIGAFLAYRYSSALSEYLMTVWTGILNALSALWFYLTYYGYSLYEVLKTNLYNVFTRYGNYISNVLQEIYLTPLTGFDLATAAGISLRTLATRYPSLEPLLIPVIYMLEQYSYYQVTQKLKEFFRK